MNPKYCFILLLYFTDMALLYSQNCCSGGIPLPNNIGLPIMEKGIMQMNLTYDYNNLNTLKSASQTIIENNRQRTTHSILLNFNYSITSKLAVESLFTWVDQQRKITRFGQENIDQSQGIGDAVLLMKYNFTNFLGKSNSLGIGLGTKIPLGSSTEVNNQNIRLSADLQPGSNAWDVIFWSTFYKQFNFRPSLNLFTNFIYRKTGKNNSFIRNRSYQFGNEILASVSLSDQYLLLSTIVSPSLIVKYRNVSLDRANEEIIEDSGGNWVFLAPSLSVNITPNLSLMSRMEIPVYSQVGGTQLTPTYRVSTGLLYRITMKKSNKNVLL